MRVTFNRKNIKLLTLFIFLISGATLVAQQNSKAVNYLKEVSRKVKSYENISIDFNFTLDNVSEEIHQEAKGSVLLSGDKYVLNILGIKRIFDSKTLYTISPEDEEVTISSVNTDDENAITPNKMLHFFENGYIAQMDILQNVNGRKIQYLKLKPIDTHSEINYVLLGIDQNTKHIYNVIEVGKNKTKTTITISRFITNQTLPKSSFMFNENLYSDYFINRLD